MTPQPQPRLSVSNGSREPAVGQRYWDRDHRVSSRYAVVVELKDDGRVVIERGRTGGGRKSTVRRDTLRRRFMPLEASHAGS
jgi:hypothetical protein